MGQMELQLQRQQAQAQRQTLDRLARRPPATSAPAQAQPSAATPATSSSSSNVKPAETSTPPSPNFLLDELVEEDGTEEGMREGAEQRAIFIGELLLGALSIQSEDPLQS